MIKKERKSFLTARFTVPLQPSFERYINKYEQKNG
jgi:hypothetical protein